MKPTYQTGHQPRHIESQRPQGAAFSKSPVTDWDFQSGADMHAGTANAVATAQLVPTRAGLYALMQGYEAETRAQDRIEALGVCAVIAIALWPIAQAVYTAAMTV